MTALINSPPNGTADDQDARGKLLAMSAPFRNFANQVFNICNALTTSGTTANRPTTMLWIGRTYFDTTLGIPIWVLVPVPGPIWVNAAGAVV